MKANAKTWAFIAFFFAASQAPLSAIAEPGRVDQLEFLDIEEGEAELESQTVWASETEDSEAGFMTGLTLEYGLSGRLAVGVEAEFGRPNGDVISLETFSIQAKWVAVDAESAPLGLGIQFSLAVDPETGDIGSETFLIAAAQREMWRAAGNLVIEAEPGDWSSPSVGFAVRADKQLSGNVWAGLEAGGGLYGEGKGSYWLGPVFVLGTAGMSHGLPGIELSAFAGLTQQTPDFQTRIELSWEV